MQRLGDTHGHQGRITHPGQSHQPHALRKRADQFACHVQGEASFATAARPNECHKTHFVASKQVAESLHSPLPSDEPRGRDEVRLVTLVWPGGSGKTDRKSTRL